MIQLQTPISYLKGVGPSRGELLGSELGIYTCADLANLFPNRYIDRSKFYKISELNDNALEVQVIGQVSSLRTVAQKKGSRLVATFVDDSGAMELVWFRGAKWIQDSIELNTTYVVFGRVNQFKGSYSIPHPEMELFCH